MNRVTERWIWIGGAVGAGVLILILIGIITLSSGSSDEDLATCQTDLVNAVESRDACTGDLVTATAARSDCETAAEGHAAEVKVISDSRDECVEARTRCELANADCDSYRDQLEDCQRSLGLCEGTVEIMQENLDACVDSRFELVQVQQNLDICRAECGTTECGQCFADLSDARTALSRILFQGVNLTFPTNAVIRDGVVDILPSFPLRLNGYAFGVSLTGGGAFNDDVDISVDFESGHITGTVPIDKQANLPRIDVVLTDINAVPFPATIHIYQIELTYVNS